MTRQRPMEARTSRSGWTRSLAMWTSAWFPITGITYPKATTFDNRSAARLRQRLCKKGQSGETGWPFSLLQQWRHWRLDLSPPQPAEDVDRQERRDGCQCGQAQDFAD